MNGEVASSADRRVGVCATAALALAAGALLGGLLGAPLEFFLEVLPFCALVLALLAGWYPGADAIAALVRRRRSRRAPPKSSPRPQLDRPFVLALELLAHTRVLRGPPARAAGSV